MTKTIDILDAQVMDIVHVVTDENTEICGYIASKSVCFVNGEPKWRIGVYIRDNHCYFLDGDQIQQIGIVVPHAEEEKELLDICKKYNIRFDRDGDCHHDIEGTFEAMAMNWSALDDDEKDVIGEAFLKDNLDRLMDAFKAVVVENQRLTNNNLSFAEKVEKFDELAKRLNKRTQQFNELGNLIKELNELYKHGGTDRVIAYRMLPKLYVAILDFLSQIDMRID